MDVNPPRAERREWGARTNEPEAVLRGRSEAPGTSDQRSSSAGSSDESSASMVATEIAQDDDAEWRMEAEAAEAAEAQAAVGAPSGGTFSV